MVFKGKAIQKRALLLKSPYILPHNLIFNLLVLVYCDCLDLHHFFLLMFLLSASFNITLYFLADILIAGTKLVPGMTAVIDKIGRPGRAFDTENHARAEWSIFDAEIKGPSAGSEASTGILSAKAFAKAELVSASASAGPVKATVGLSADSGIEIGPTQVEAKVLGTGISFGRKVGISLFGSGIEFELW